MAEQAGKMELISTPAKVANRYIRQKWKLKWNTAFEETLGGFVPNYVLAQTIAHAGEFQRAQMPVLEEEDISGLRHMLSRAGHHIPIKTEWMNVGHLVPTQKQIYVDKTMDYIVDNGVLSTIDSYSNGHIFISKDDDIIDGHHRWLSAMFIGPQIKVKVAKIGENEKAALKDALKWSDEHHRLRNA